MFSIVLHRGLALSPLASGAVPCLLVLFIAARGRSGRTAMVARGDRRVNALEERFIRVTERRPDLILPHPVDLDLLVPARLTTHHADTALGDSQAVGEEHADRGVGLAALGRSGHPY